MSSSNVVTITPMPVDTQQQKCYVCLKCIENGSAANRPQNRRNQFFCDQCRTSSQRIREVERRVLHLQEQDNTKSLVSLVKSLKCYTSKCYNSDGYSDGVLLLLFDEKDAQRAMEHVPELKLWGSDMIFLHNCSACGGSQHNLCGIQHHKQQKLLLAQMRRRGRKRKEQQRKSHDDTIVSFHKMYSTKRGVGNSYFDVYCGNCYKNNNTFTVLALARDIYGFRKTEHHDRKSKNTTVFATEVTNNVIRGNKTEIYHANKRSFPSAASCDISQQKLMCDSCNKQVGIVIFNRPPRELTWEPSKIPRGADTLKIATYKLFYRWQWNEEVPDSGEVLIFRLNSQHKKHKMNNSDAITVSPNIGVRADEGEYEFTHDFSHEEELIGWLEEACKYKEIQIHTLFPLLYENCDRKLLMEAVFDSNFSWDPQLKSIRKKLTNVQYSADPVIREKLLDKLYNLFKEKYADRTDERVPSQSLADPHLQLFGEYVPAEDRISQDIEI